MYCGKSGCIRSKWLYSGKSCCNKAKWFDSSKSDIFWESGSILANVVLFGQSCCIRE